MKSHRRLVRHAQIHLPSLDPHCALALVNVLDRAIAAIWRAHDDGMAELLQQPASARSLPPPEYIDDGDSNASDDTLF
jgi:hypothetical protein